MSSKIRITVDEMRYIALFESVTGAVVKDCVIDNKMDQIIIIVKPGDIRLAVGKHGSHVKLFRRMIGENVEVVEYDENPVEFIKNSFTPARIKVVRITERPDGRKIAAVTVEPHDKGVAIGKKGRTAERTRFLAKRYFEIDNVIII